MHTMQPAPPRSGFHLGSAISGFAIGMVVTFLAAIAVVPDGTSQRGTPVALDTYGAGDGAEFVDDEGAAVDAQGNPVQGGGSRSSSSSKKAAGGAAGTGGSAAGGAAGSAGRAAGGTGAGSNVAGGAAGGSAGGSAGGGGACEPGKNGGATDVGITDTQIKLGATIAESGIADYFLGEVRQGMEAQVKKINRAGGICGRQLRVIYKDDGWNPDTGNRYLQNLVEGEKVFALAVSPSSEGLNTASRGGYFAKQGVPVVGADGLNVTQFKDPMIWPVAAATTTTIDVMMKNAADRAGGGANLRPAIVYGKGYRFGIEGAYAANEAYKRVCQCPGFPGYENPLEAPTCKERFCGITPTDKQFQTKVSVLKDACAFGTPNACNFMIMLLEPSTAQDWMAVSGVPQPKDFAFGMGAPQPLFTFAFANTCSDKCDGLWLWTGYNPPLDRYKSSPAVAAYESDLHGQSPSADKFNQFTMGGYIGMQLLIEALKQVGPNLTRAALVAKLNSMAPLDTGLTTPLQWRPNARYANHSAQAFKIEARNGFTGWVLQQEPMRDPWLGQHTA